MTTRPRVHVIELTQLCHSQSIWSTLPQVTIDTGIGYSVSYQSYILAGKIPSYRKYRHISRQSTCTLDGQGMGPHRHEGLQYGHPHCVGISTTLTTQDSCFSHVTAVSISSPGSGGIYPIQDCWMMESGLMPLLPPLTPHSYHVTISYPEW